MHGYPRTIENGAGEALVFLGVVPDQGGDRLEVEVRAQPGAGPPMHVHYLQEEAMTVVGLASSGFRLTESNRATPRPAKR